VALVQLKASTSKRPVGGSVLATSLKEGNNEKSSQLSSQLPLVIKTETSSFGMIAQKASPPTSSVESRISPIRTTAGDGEIDPLKITVEVASCDIIFFALFFRASFLHGRVYSRHFLSSRAASVRLLTFAVSLLYSSFVSASRQGAGAFSL
jgi:hypothetical protein